MLEIIQADLANPEHAAALISLLNSYALDPMGGGEALPEASRENLPAALRARGDSLALLAFDDGRPAGLLIGFEGFSTFACRPLLNIHDVVVLKEYRGRGISSAMLLRVEQIARERGYCKMTLEVLEGNAPARASYASFGFKGYQLNPQLGVALFWEKKL